MFVFIFQTGSVKQFLISLLHPFLGWKRIPPLWRWSPSSLKHLNPLFKSRKTEFDFPLLPFLSIRFTRMRLRGENSFLGGTFRGKYSFNGRKVAVDEFDRAIVCGRREFWVAVLVGKATYRIVIDTYIPRIRSIICLLMRAGSHWHRTGGS